MLQVRNDHALKWQNIELIRRDIRMYLYDNSKKRNTIKFKLFIIINCKTKTVYETVDLNIKVGRYWCIASDRMHD